MRSLFNANLFTAGGPLLPESVYLRLRAIASRHDRIKTASLRRVGFAPIGKKRADDQRGKPGERGKPRHEDHAGAHVGQHG